MGWRKLFLGLVLVACLVGFVAPTAEAGVKYWQVAGTEWLLSGPGKERLTGLGSHSFGAESYLIFGPTMAPAGAGPTAPVLNLDWDEAIMTIAGEPVRFNYAVKNGRIVLHPRPGVWRDIVGPILDEAVACGLGCDLLDFSVKKAKVAVKYKPWQSMKVKVKIKAVAEALCEGEPKTLKYSTTVKTESPSWWWPYP